MSRKFDWKLKMSKQKFKRHGLYSISQGAADLQIDPDLLRAYSIIGDRWTIAQQITTKEGLKCNLYPAGNITGLENRLKSEERNSYETDNMVLARILLSQAESGKSYYGNKHTFKELLSTYLPNEQESISKLFPGYAKKDPK